MAGWRAAHAPGHARRAESGRGYVIGAADRDDNGSADALEGVSVENLTSQMARDLNLPASAAGVVVSRSQPRPVAAASAGLKQGDVIQEVNRRPVKNVAEFEAAVRNSKEGTLLLVNRDGHTIYVGV